MRGLKPIALILVLASPPGPSVSARSRFPRVPSAWWCRSRPAASPTSPRPGGGGAGAQLKNPVGVVNQDRRRPARWACSPWPRSKPTATLCCSRCRASPSSRGDKLSPSAASRWTSSLHRAHLRGSTVLVVRVESREDRQGFHRGRPEPVRQISYSSSGHLRTLHMAMELLSHAAQIKLRHVPYAARGPRSPRCWRSRGCARLRARVVLPQIKRASSACSQAGASRGVPALPRSRPSRSWVSGCGVLHLGRRNSAEGHPSPCWPGCARDWRRRRGRPRVQGGHGQAGDPDRLQAGG